MPWPTTSGLCILSGREGDLVLGSIGMMVDQLVAESRGEIQQIPYGIEWFDQWDPGQRLWLLEHVTRAMFSNFKIDSAAAIFDATADAVFYEIFHLVELEIDEESFEKFSAQSSKSSWRQSILAARRQQTRTFIQPSKDSTDLEAWGALISRVADHILGIRLYQRAETFRDRDYKQTQVFLRDRGLPADYLSRIPDLRTIDQTQLSIDRIQAYVFKQ